MPRTRRHHVAAVLALAACASVGAGCGGSSEEGSSSASSGGGLPKTIRIGVPLDTSGSSAVAGVGQSELDGVRFGAEEINRSGLLGGSKLELQVDDTRADKQQAVATVRRYIQGGDAVDAVVGFTLTPSFLATAQLLQRAGTPTMAVGLSADGVTEAGDKIFRIYPALTRLFTKTDPSFIQATGAKTAAYLYGNDTETTQGQFEQRRKLLEGLGVKTVATQTVTANDTDVRAQLSSIKASNPDVVVLDVNTGQQPGILVQAQELGILPATPLLGDVGFGNETVLEQGREALQCSLFATTWTADAKTGDNAHFVQAFTEAEGHAPDAYAAWGRDAIKAMAQAFEAAGSTDGDAVAAALAKSKVDGALGSYGFDAERQPTQTGIRLQIDDGKQVEWTPETECRR